MENKLPEGWEWKKLGDLTEKFVSGGTPPTKNESYWNGTIPWTTSAKINSRFIDFSEKYITDDAVKNSATNIVPKNNVLIATRVGIGKSAVNLIDLAISQDLTGVVLNKSLILPTYLVLYLHSPKLKQNFELSARGSTIRGLTRSDVENIQVPLPPLETQQKTVSILEKAEEKIKLRAQADELTQKLLQSMFLEMFDGSNANDWPVTTLEEVVRPNKGSMRTGPFGSQLLHSEFVEEGIAVLGIDNAVKNYFEWSKRRFISESKYEELKRYTVYPGDVVITIMGTCGRCAIIPDDIPLSINTKHLCCITLNQEKCLPIYLHGYFLQHPIARQYLLSKANGAIMDGLNMKIIKDMPIIIPPIELQKKYGAIVQKINETKQTQQQCSFETNNLFDTLMQKAFTGELVS